MHRRQVIRNAIVVALSGIGATVVVGRVYPDDETGTPGVNVVTGDETVLEEQQTMNPNSVNAWIQTRALEMDIECRVVGASTDDLLDATALEVEQALGADVTLGGECDKIEYASSSAELAGDIDKPIGLRTLSYMVLYRVDARDPQALEG